MIINDYQNHLQIWIFSINHLLTLSLSPLLQSNPWTKSNRTQKSINHIVTNQAWQYFCITQSIPIQPMTTASPILSWPCLPVFAVVVCPEITKSPPRVPSHTPATYHITPSMLSAVPDALCPPPPSPSPICPWWRPKPKLDASPHHHPPCRRRNPCPETLLPVQFSPVPSSVSPRRPWPEPLLISPALIFIHPGITTTAPLSPVQPCSHRHRSLQFRRAQPLLCAVAPFRAAQPLHFAAALNPATSLFRRPLPPHHEVAPCALPPSPARAVLEKWEIRNESKKIDEADGSIKN